MKKIVFALLVFFISISNVFALEINSRNAVLYNLNDNEIIYEKNKDEITSIASLTKIMTTLVSIDKISDMNEKVTITSSMLKGLAEAHAAVAGLKVGQKVTYNDLLYCLFLPSGADAARALSISLAGSEDEFVKLMNDKAKKLGLNKTIFTNTTGLDTAGQTSTVNDVAKLLMESLKNDKFKEVFYAKSYTISDKSITVYSTLISTAKKYKVDYSSFLGGKTGFTDNAGRCLASVGYDSENDITYLLVTTKADDNNKGEHVKDAYKVYDYYFKNYKYHNLVDKGDLLTNIKTKYVDEKSINFYADSDVSAYLENTYDKKDVKLTYTGLNILKAGLKKGTKVGSIEVSYNNKVYKNIDVILTENVKFSLLVFVKDNIIALTIGFIVIALFTIIFIKSKKKKKRK